MMSAKRAEPFSVLENAIVVQGGYLGSSPWVPNVTSVGGDTGFFTLDKYDRNIARAFGFHLSILRPMQNVTLFSHIAKLRDEAIDKLIMEHKVSNDPMGCQPTNAASVLRGREKAFRQASIPPTVEVETA